MLSEAYYNLTDRGIRAHEIITQFRLERIAVGALVLNVGSGYMQRFEQEVKLVRPDVKVFSVDPSLMGGKVRYGGFDRKRVSAYLDKGEIKQRRVLINQLSEGHTVAASGVALPFKAGLFDCVLDVLGPGFFLGSGEELEVYFRSVFEVLKQGGEFHLAVVGRAKLLPDLVRMMLEGVGFCEVNLGSWCEEGIQAVKR